MGSQPAEDRAMPLVPYADLDKASPQVGEAFGRFAKTMNVFRRHCQRKCTNG